MMSRMCMIGSDEEDEDGNLSEGESNTKKTTIHEISPVGEVIYLSGDTSCFQPEDDEITDMPVSVVYAVSSSGDGSDDEIIGHSTRKRKMINRSSRSKRACFINKRQEVIDNKHFTAERDPLDFSPESESTIALEDEDNQLRANENNSNFKKTIAIEQSKLKPNENNLSQQSVNTNKQTQQTTRNNNLNTLNSTVKKHVITDESRTGRNMTFVKRSAEKTPKALALMPPPIKRNFSEDDKKKYARQATPFCDAIMKEYSKRQKQKRTQGGDGSLDVDHSKIQSILKKANKATAEETKKDINSGSNKLPETFMNKNIKVEPSDACEEAQTSKHSDLLSSNKQHFDDEPVVPQPINFIDVKPCITDINLSLFGSSNSDPTYELVTNSKVKDRKPYIGNAYENSVESNRNKAITHTKKRENSSKNKDDDDPDYNPDYYPGHLPTPRINTRSRNKLNLKYNENETQIKKPETINVAKRMKSLANKIADVVLSNETSPNIDGEAEKLLQTTQELLKLQKETSKQDSLNYQKPQCIEGPVSDQSILRSHRLMSFHEKCVFIMDYFTSYVEVFNNHFISSDIQILSEIVLISMDNLTECMQRTTKAKSITYLELQQNEMELAKQSYLQERKKHSTRFYHLFNPVVNRIGKTKSSKALMVTLILYITRSVLNKASRYASQIHKVRHVLSSLLKSQGELHQLVWQVLQEPDHVYEEELKLMIQILKYFQRRKFVSIPLEKIIINDSDEKWEEEPFQNIELFVKDTSSSELPFSFLPTCEEISQSNKPKTRGLDPDSNDDPGLRSQHLVTSSLQPFNSTSKSNFQLKVSGIAVQLMEAVHSESQCDAKRIEDKLDQILSALSKKSKLEEVSSGPSGHKNRNINNIGVYSGTSLRDNLSTNNLREGMKENPHQFTSPIQDVNDENLSNSDSLPLNVKDSMLDQLFENKHGGLDSLFESYLKSTEKSKVRIKSEPLDINDDYSETIIHERNDYSVEKNQELNEGVALEGNFLNNACEEAQTSKKSYPLFLSTKRTFEDEPIVPQPFHFIDVKPCITDTKSLTGSNSDTQKRRRGRPRRKDPTYELATKTKIKGRQPDIANISDNSVDSMHSQGFQEFANILDNDDSSHSMTAYTEHGRGQRVSAESVSVRDFSRSVNQFSSDLEWRAPCISSVNSESSSLLSFTVLQDDMELANEVKVKEEPVIFPKLEEPDTD